MSHWPTEASTKSFAQHNREEKTMRLFHKLALAIVLISLLAMLFPISVAVAEEVVTFPAPNLEAAIREAIGKPTGAILQSDLVGLTTLNANTRSVTDLTGLEHCTSLTVDRLLPILPTRDRSRQTVSASGLSRSKCQQVYRP
jgi:hypothetical protein